MRQAYDYWQDQPGSYRAPRAAVRPPRLPRCPRDLVRDRACSYAEFKSIRSFHSPSPGLDALTEPGRGRPGSPSTLDHTRTWPTNTPRGVVPSFGRFFFLGDGEGISSERAAGCPLAGPGYTGPSSPVTKLHLTDEFLWTTLHFGTALLDDTERARRSRAVAMSPLDHGSRRSSRRESPVADGALPRDG